MASATGERVNIQIPSNSGGIQWHVDQSVRMRVEDSSPAGPRTPAERGNTPGSSTDRPDRPTSSPARRPEDMDDFQGGFIEIHEMIDGGKGRPITITYPATICPLIDALAAAAQRDRPGLIFRNSAVELKCLYGIDGSTAFQRVRDASKTRRRRTSQT